MEVILLENVANLGVLGDKVSVKSGYGRNYLIPQHKAVPATEENLKVFEARRAELQKEAEAQLARAQQRAAAINDLTISIVAKAGEEGKLFGSVTVRDIADEATAKGVEVDRSEVRLPEGPLREVGDFEIDIHLHPEVNAVLKVNVTSDEDAE